MPFNIEIGKYEDTRIKIQVSKNTLTIYFISSDKENRIKTLRDWTHLESDFSDNLNKSMRDWVRGPTSSHIKRNHTNEREVEPEFDTHYHIEFNTEVGHELFADYFTEFYEQQLSLEHYDPEITTYRFFEPGEVDWIIASFYIYYNEYKESVSEALFNAKTTLTPLEEAIYGTSHSHPDNSSCGAYKPLRDPKKPDLASIALVAHVSAGRHGLFPKATLVSSLDSTQLEIHDECSNCGIDKSIQTFNLFSGQTSISPAPQDIYLNSESDESDEISRVDEIQEQSSISFDPPQNILPKFVADDGNELSDIDMDETSPSSIMEL